MWNNVYFHSSRNKKQIALTFDDGPSKQTEDILDILKKNNIRATFFVVGKKIKGNENILKRIVEERSEIGNHSYDHIRLSFREKEVIKKQIKLTDNELLRLGIKTNIFRPPSGCFGFNLIKICKEMEKEIILWDVDPSDWKCLPKNEIVERVLRKVKSGSIIDLHDYAEGIGENKELPKSLKIIIPYFKGKGYEFVTVSELLQLL